MANTWSQLRTALLAEFKNTVPFTKTFLKKETILLAGKIQSKFYSGGKGLSVRSGKARRGWKNRVYTQGQTVIGEVFNDVPHSAFHMKARTIRPKGKFLAIPVGKGLRSNRSNKYSGPRDPRLPDLNMIPFKNKQGYLLYDANYKRRKNKRIPNNKLYFVYKKSVRIKGRTKGLFPYAEGEMFKISNRYLDDLGKFLRAKK